MEAMKRAVRLKTASLMARVQTHSTWCLPQPRNICSRLHPAGSHMLRDSIRNLVFPSVRRLSNSTIEDVEERTKRFDLLDRKSQYLADLEIELPTLLGTDIEEHFRNVGKKFTAPYLNALNILVSATVPPVPSRFVFVEGWVRYASNGKTFKSVAAPEGDALVFDVETVVTEGGLPAMAVALSDRHWYSWCSPALVGGRDHRVEMVTPEVLIPLGTSDRETVVVGHSIGFDRSFLREEYEAGQSKRHFLDTLSMHVCVSGQTTAQRMMTAVRKKWDQNSNDSPAAAAATKLASIGEVFNWGKVSTLNNLADVYRLYCQAELSKSARRTFETGTSADVRADFQALMRYCFFDVKATRDVLVKLLPLFVERSPHPVSLFGILEILTAYLPVNRDWTRYLGQANTAYNDTNSEIQHTLNMLVNRVCRMQQDASWKNDPWLWDLDWSTQTRTVKCRQQKTAEDATPSQTANCDSTSNPDMSTYPKWYRELCVKPLGDEFTKEFGVWDISTRKRCIPKLLKLTWDGYPLHFHQDYGWGYLVPGGGRNNKNSNGKLDRCDSTAVSGFPLSEYTRIIKETRKEAMKRCRLAAIQPVEAIQDLNDLSSQDSYQDWKTMREVFRSQFASDQQKKASEEEEGMTVKSKLGVAITGADIDIGLRGVLFRRLPHKNGVMYNVGNPLTSDFIEKYHGHLLGSWDDENAGHLLQLMKQNIHWDDVRERVEQQMVVWTSKDRGAVLPRLLPAGTINRRPMEMIWLSGSQDATHRLGSEHRAMVQAPQGMHFVRAHLESSTLELWIASLLGDSALQGKHGSTAFGRITPVGTKADGTDLHSKSAAVLGCPPDYAKIIDVARIYGAETTFLASLLQKFDPNLTKEESHARCEKLLRSTKGVWQREMNASMDQRHWANGTESHTFNALIRVASEDAPRTPFLGAQITRALAPAVVGFSYRKARQAWVTQSSAVDYLHLMLVSMRDLFERFDIDGRLVLASHDEMSYMVRSEDRYRAALALHISNLFVRAMFATRLGIHDLPFDVAFLSAVSVDKSLRRDVMSDCVTPSNALGLTMNYGVPLGEVLSINQAIEKTAGGKLSA